MPELPEVETVKRRLASVLPGKSIKKVKILHSKSLQGDPQEIIGLNVDQISRQAKLLRVDLSSNLNLLIHLKMTGQLIYTDHDHKLGGGHPTADWVRDLPGKHTRVIFELQPQSKLFFNDMRIFGWIRVLSDSQVQEEFESYGPDAIDQEFTAQYLQERLKNRTIAIKQAIMINDIVGGIGNIYASEALFAAGIDPGRSSQDLSLEELKKVVNASKQVIKEGIEAGGTTFDGQFVDVDGLAGNYQDKLKVYGRQDQPCIQCDGRVKKVKISNRGTYYCPQCQS